MAIEGTNTSEKCFLFQRFDCTGIIKIVVVAMKIYINMAFILFLFIRNCLISPVLIVGEVEVQVATATAEQESNCHQNKKTK